MFPEWLINILLRDLRISLTRFTLKPKTFGDFVANYSEHGIQWLCFELIWVKLYPYHEIENVRSINSACWKDDESKLSWQETIQKARALAKKDEDK